MFDFGEIDKKRTEYVEKEKPKLDIGTLLKHIDTADYDFYDSLDDDIKKQFQPYTALRWVSSLDDSMAVTYKAKDVEAVFGKWTAGGKEALNELKEEINKTKINSCSSVSKYEHAKYDWRIKFSVSSESASKLVIDEMMEMGLTSISVESLVSKETAQYQLLLLNDLVNENFWEMQNHPELVYSLLCATQSVVGQGEMKHNWLPFCKGMSNVNSEILEVMKKQCSELSAAQLNLEEYKILLSSYTDDEFTSLVKDMGNTESEIKSLVKLFKSEKEKHLREKTKI